MLAIALGVAVLVLLVVSWRTLKAAATRFPIDDFDKPWNP